MMQELGQGQFSLHCLFCQMSLNHSDNNVRNYTYYTIQQNKFRNSANFIQKSSTNLN